MVGMFPQRNLSQQIPIVINNQDMASNPVDINNQDMVSNPVGINNPDMASNLVGISNLADINSPVGINRADISREGINSHMALLLLLEHLHLALPLWAYSLILLRA